MIRAKNCFFAPFGFVFLLLAVASNTCFADEGYRSIDSEKISPGVFRFNDEYGTQIRAYGISGKVLALEKMEKTLFDEHGNVKGAVDLQVLDLYNQLAKSVLAHHASERSETGGEIQSSNSYEEDSGSFCGISYSLDVGTGRNGFWYMGGAANASFVGNGGLGPPAPAHHMITVYAESITTRADGTQVVSIDTDTQHFNFWGQVTAGAHTIAGPSASCMETSVIAYVWYPECTMSSDRFRFVSTSGSLHC